MRAPVCVACLGLVGCRAIVEPGVEYRDCDLSHYEDEFDSGMENFYEKCWRVANVDPIDEEEGRVAVTVQDGDVIMKMDAPEGNVSHLEWSGTDQGPMAYQRLTSDFFVVARLEALNPIDASHCIEPGNLAGLAMRSVDNPSQWVSYLMGPVDPMRPACEDEAMLPKPDTHGELQTNQEPWGSPFDTRDPWPNMMMWPSIGDEGDAFLSICRVGETVKYSFKDPESSNEMPTWVDLPVNHTIGGGLDVGPAISAREATMGGQGFQIEGHFDWILYMDTLAVDGCTGAREKVVLPPTGS
jgi:hypothetical protein